MRSDWEQYKPDRSHQVGGTSYAGPNRSRATRSLRSARAFVRGSSFTSISLVPHDAFRLQ